MDTSFYKRSVGRREEAGHLDFLTSYISQLVWHHFRLFIRLHLLLVGQKKGSMLEFEVFFGRVSLLEILSVAIDFVP